MKLKELINQQILLITDNDLDGVIGGLVFVLAYSPKNEIKWIHSRKFNVDEMILNGEIFDYEHVVFIDKTPHEQQSMALLEQYANVYVCDHHLSAKSILGNIEDYNFDITKCSTKIVYDALNELKLLQITPNLTKLIQLTNLYDMWEEEMGFKDALKLNQLFKFLGGDSDKCINYFKNYIENQEYDGLFEAIGYQDYLKLEEEYIKNKVNQAYISDNRAITFAEKNMSEIGNAILKKNPKLDVALIVNIANNSISIRSKKGLALDYARRLGMNYGGHLNASGCYMGELKMEIIDNILKRC